MTALEHSTVIVDGVPTLADCAFWKAHGVAVCTCGRILGAAERMSEPTPAQRGMLDRYQDQRLKYRYQPKRRP